MIAEMAPSQSEERPAEPTRHQSFATTHWSVVLAARDTDSPEADAALAELCRTYWYPLYAFIRRKGHSPHDAEDLTQAFFARLLEKNYIAQADRERGRFRTYLLAARTHFPAAACDGRAGSGSVPVGNRSRSTRPWRRNATGWSRLINSTLRNFTNVAGSRRSS